MLPPIRVLGGEKFGYFPEPITPGLESVALEVCLVEISPETKGVDLTLQAPVDWQYYFRIGTENHLGVSAIKHLAQRKGESEMPHGVRVLEVGDETNDPDLWPVWFKWVGEMTGTGKMIELGVPANRTIFPTTRCLIEAGLVGVAMASAKAIELERLLKIKK
jgi:hypothetical protein